MTLSLARNVVMFVFALVVACALIVFMCVSTTQAQGPVKLISAGHVGTGTESSVAGGFTFPEGAAGAPNGNFYVADQGNHRVQEFTASGTFVLMFGKEVDATTHGDICTAASGDVCQAGKEGTAVGQFGHPHSVAVDPVSEDVYVADYIFGEGGGSTTEGQRVQEFTAAGQFVLELGKEVNETTGQNRCTQEEIEKAGVKCVGAAQEAVGSEPVSEHGVFRLQQFAGNVLAVGGEQDRLYVGEEHRVQEFDAEGEWVAEIPLAGISSERGRDVMALAVDDKSSVLYLVYGTTGLVRVFDFKGEKLQDLTVSPREVENSVEIESLAVDAGGHLAVSAVEEDNGTRKRFGSLYSVETGLRITEFVLPNDTIAGIGFNGAGELYVAASTRQEVLRYAPVPVAELVVGMAECVQGAEKETSVTYTCKLNGEVNPEGVEETEVWFEWGRTEALGTITPRQPVGNGEALVSASTTLEGLRPNETFYYRLAGQDRNVQPPEQLTSAVASFSTPAVAPQIIGAPTVSFVKSGSTVMFGELNPENANTEYFFEYAPGEALAACPGTRKASCPEVATTKVLQSSLYARVGATLQAKSLQPGTSYHYRLAAISSGGEAKGSGAGEGAFTTAPAPAVQAETGLPAAVTSTSATIAGVVDGDGQPATYRFELGLEKGGATQYGIVLSGSTGTAPEAKTFVVTGLQPGTTYAYRITAESGYGTVQGAPVTFTTVGRQAILMPPVPLAQLSTPRTIFPKAVPTAKAKTRKAGNRKAKKRKARKRGRGTRSHAKGRSK
jgi:hypothetical protein